jgi:hypothetical protein
MSYVAMNAVDPAKDGDKAFVTLGPTFPDGVIGPTLTNASGVTVVSFGKEFLLRLPCEATGWTMGEPPPDKPAVLVTDRGSFFVPTFCPPDRDSSSRATSILRRASCKPRRMANHMPFPMASPPSPPNGSS